MYILVPLYIQILHCIKIKKTVDYFRVTPILLLPLTYSFYIVIRLTNHFHVCLYVEHAPKKSVTKIVTRL